MVAPAIPLITNPAEGQEMGLILGRKPGSKYEWYTAVALVRYKWSFSYQVNYFGGRRIAGGQVLDFLVYTRALPTPLYVYGPHWHEQASKDRDRFQRMQLYNRLRGAVRLPIVFDERHTASQQAALAAVKKYFGVGG